MVRFSLTLTHTHICSHTHTHTILYSLFQQAQTYFAGQSRYVGVYDTSRMAARAYVTVQDFLRKYRDNRSLTKDSPKEELARIFSTARKAADDAVLELKHSDNEMATGAGNKTADAAAAAAPPSQTEETMDGDDNHDTDSASV